MTLDEESLRFAETAHERLLELEHETDLARMEFHHGLRRLHAAGGSLREIADHFGLSHQRVHQIVDTTQRAGKKGKSTMLVELIKGRRTGTFRRFDKDARSVVVRSQQEAAELGHGFIGTEHLLLGILGGPQNTAAQVLAALGVDRAQVGEAIVQAVGRGDAAPTDERLPFTARAKKVLELSLREAAALNHDYIGPEHILLGLVRDSSGLAARILRDLGADPARVRTEIERAVEGHTA
jgi:ATP-dependent Clp protease ATP-binding subunit ClpC